LFSVFRFQDIAHKDGRYPSARVNVLVAGLQLAGFQVITTDGFEVIPEGKIVMSLASLLAVVQFASGVGMWRKRGRGDKI
jgi:hypothetical protein